MQVFSLPDAHVAFACAQDRESANELLAKFNIFQIVEDPVLRGGETFSTSKDASKRVIHRWPDACYPRGHSCHNPFGVWRLRAAGSTEKLVKLGELTLVFVPALVAKLLAVIWRAAPSRARRSSAFATTRPVSRWSRATRSRWSASAATQTWSRPRRGNSGRSRGSQNDAPLSC
jgi:hypothetical protein